MKTSQLLFTALLGLGISSAACAQTTVPGTTGVPGMPGAASGTGATVPGQASPNIGNTMPSTTLPTSPAATGTAPGAIYTPGTVAPGGTPGVLPAGQPAGMTPRNTPARGVRRANGTTTTPVRP